MFCFVNFSYFAAGNYEQMFYDDNYFGGDTGRKCSIHDVKYLLQHWSFNVNNKQKGGTIVVLLQEDRVKRFRYE
jgi:hypothetical protein